MVAHLTSGSHGLGELVQLDRHAFAAKIRLSRAVLGWSQSELGRRIGLTQRAIHKLEQGETQPRRSTVRALEEIWYDHDIKFENLAAGGFRVSVPPSALDRPEGALRRPGGVGTFTTDQGLRARSARVFVNSARTLSTTEAQSPLLSCRNSRAVGYQGESVRSSSHRQSELNDKRIQTGLPNAPARLTIDVSLDIMRSNDSITAAVSKKSFSSLPRCLMCGFAFRISASPSRRSFWRLKNVAPETEQTGKIFFNVIERSRSFLKDGLPAHAMPILNLLSPSFDRQ